MLRRLILDIVYKGIIMDVSIKINMDRYIFYKRKSSDSEDRQILSLESQDRTIKETTTGFNGFKIISDYEESKSAKAPGRPKFNEMCEKLERGLANYIICWQLNRLARNPVDGGRIIWLVQNYGVKIVTPSKTYGIDDILLMYVEFAMSNQFINDLKKSTTRGLNDKLHAGIAPIRAPIGYYNDVTKKQGLRDILVDDLRFPLVRKMWDLFLSGNYSVPRILDMATNQWGLRQRNGRPFSRTQAFRLFRNVFYTGKYEYKGEIHIGVHQPMITIDEYDKAQKILGNNGGFRLSKHTFAFNNKIIHCTCGSGVTAHERYRKVCSKCHHKYNAVINSLCPKCKTPAPEETWYGCLYHCTRKKNSKCTQPSVKLKDLEEQFDYYISSLTLPSEFIDWVLVRLRKAHEEESRSRDTININLQATLNATTRKLDNLLSKYLSEENKTGEIISDEEYKRQKWLLADQKTKMEESLKGFSKRQDDWLTIAEKALDFARTAQEKFKTASKEEKREMVLSFGLNLTLENRKLYLDLLKPFGKIKEAADRLRDPSEKIEPVQRIDTKGQTFYFDSANPIWGD